MGTHRSPRVMPAVAPALAIVLAACGGGEEGTRTPVQGASAQRAVVASPGAATGARSAAGPTEAAAAFPSDPNDRYNGPRRVQQVTADAQQRKGRWPVGQGVRALAISPDGASIATVSSEDGLPRVLDAASQRPRVAFTAEAAGPAAATTFIGNGRYIASAGRDTVTRVWQADTGALRLTLLGHSQPIRTVAASADGARLATGGEDTRVMVWNASSGKLEHVLTGHRDFVNTLAFSPDGRLLASAGADALVLITDVATGRLLHTLRGHAGDVDAVAFSPDGRRLASAGRDARIHLWDVTSGRAVALLDGHQAPVRDVAFSADGSMLASGDGSGQILVWDMTTRQRVRELSTGSRAGINTLAFDTRNRNVLFAGGDDNRLVRWNVSAGTPG